MVVRRGGRSRVVAVEEIVRAGRALGMRRLSVKAVAEELGVSAPALYRYVENRWALERLVGESILADLQLPDNPDNPDDDTARHLLSFALRLRGFALAHPGLASYLQVLFPRGDEGVRLLNAEVDALGRRGYSTDVAVVLSGAVASLAISLAASEESDAEARGRDDGFAREQHAVADRLLADVHLGPAHANLSQVSTAEFVRLLLTASIKGLLSVAPPGRPVEEIVAELSAQGAGL